AAPPTAPGVVAPAVAAPGVSVPVATTPLVTAPRAAADARSVLRATGCTPSSIARKVVVTTINGPYERRTFTVGDRREADITSLRHGVGGRFEQATLSSPVEESDGG